MQRGVKWIKGKEYLLAGRYHDKEEALRAHVWLRDQWESVKVRRSRGALLGEWGIWVHGGRPNWKPEFEPDPVPGMPRLGLK